MFIFIGCGQTPLQMANVQHAPRAPMCNITKRPKALGKSIKVMDMATVGVRESIRIMAHVRGIQI